MHTSNFLLTWISIRDKYNQAFIERDIPDTIETQEVDLKF